MLLALGQGLGVVLLGIGFIVLVGGNAAAGQAPLSNEMCRAAMAVFRPDLYDEATAATTGAIAHPPASIGAFTGPAFDPRDIAGHLAAWRIGRVG